MKIAEFIESLPRETSEMVTNCMGVKIRTAHTIKQASAALAVRGMLGMLPFAEYGRLPLRLGPPTEEYALRLLPGVPLESTEVVVCFEGVPIARTVAPNFQEFPAGALAFSGVRGQVLTDELQSDLLSFAAQFGATANTKAILNAYSEEDHEESALLRVCEGNAYYKIFSRLLAADKATRIRTAKELLEQYPDNKAIFSTLADYQIRSGSGMDVSVLVWKMTQEDIVCDSYIGMRSGSSWLPIKNAIRWLIKSGNDAVSKEYPLLYEAAIAWAQSDTYHGEKHLEFARKLADTNPKLAFTQTSNAAAIYAAATGKAPIDAIVFAGELAARNRWEELSQVLGWARGELENGTIGTGK